MSTSPPSIELGSAFATDLPELALPWQAEQAPEPRLLALNETLALELGLDPDWLRSDSGLGLLLGTDLPPEATPVAQAYAGHQFGGYSPRLGDGRALLVGELAGRDLHLKGSGRTPFARGGDGRAAVGPMLREYVVSEAMHALDIPTTRALAVVRTGRWVQREGALPGAVLARVASSHLRVGSFQLARSTGDLELLRRLTDHAIGRHHPDAAESDNPALALFQGVVAVQASLVARWMLVGFVHGVMNTDNVTISGETIDYGPCAFLEAFDPATTFSSIDEGGRYSYGNQPRVMPWNLARLAEALLPLVHDDEAEAVALVTDSLSGFSQHCSAAWSTGLRRKLGLFDTGSDSSHEALVADFLQLLQDSHPDFTSFFWALGLAASGDREPARSLVLDLAAFDSWLERWLALGPDATLMQCTNPAVVPRNHLVEEALDAATAGDLEPFERLVDAVTHPFEERPGNERYTEPAPETFGGYTTYCGT